MKSLRISDLITKLRAYGPRKFIRHSLYETYAYFYKRLYLRSFTQEGEDLFLDRELNYKTRGFYVDIGANDPIRFNNTKRFYDKGWSGINIEPNQNLWKSLKRERSRDINLNLGVGNQEKEIVFYKFTPHTISTFSKHQADLNIKQGYKLIDRSTVRIKPLSSIFEEFAKKKRIDFMSIDTEGMDLEVLKSNNWKEFKPTFICVEILHQGRLSGEKKDIYKFLKSKDYKIVWKGQVNSIFKLDQN